MDMWIGDLAQAIHSVRQFKNDKNFCIKSAVPAVDDIVFETTYFTYIKFYYEDGHVEEQARDDWRKRGKAE
jgi:hypothetical protein